LALVSITIGTANLKARGKLGTCDRGAKDHHEHAN